MRSPAARLALAVCSASALALHGCAGPPPCDALGCAPACPRDAVRDATGRCACAPRTLLALGACVSPAIADAYCGPGERMGAGGCAAAACGPDEVVDLATGACDLRSALRREGAPCGDAGVAVARAGDVACLSPADACPRGTSREGDRCARPPACPAGTLPEGPTCRPVVTAGGGPSGAPRVDAGAWAYRVLGADGGQGSTDLCRALALRADAFDVPRGETRRVLVHVALDIPDQDTTRTTVSVQAASVPRGDAGILPARTSSAAAEVVERAVAALVEPFRGLGAESTTASLVVTVRCDVAVP